MKQRILAFLAALVLLPGLAQAKIFLVDTDDTLRVVTASGVSTIHMYAAWADMTTTALTPGNSDAQVTTATTTVLVAAPGASTQRQIKGLSIRNSHASSSNLITVQFYDGATATELIAYTLLAGETLQWGEDENFRVIDASGQVKGAVTANAGTNLNTSALLTTSAHDAAFGTAGSADSQVRSVQGIPSMTPLLVNPGTATNFGVYAEDSVHASGDNLVLAGVVRSDAAAALAADGDRTVLQVDANGYLKVVNINPNLAADNSTLSTSKVPVLPGTVSTSAPTWTNGNQSALSLQTDGSVRAAITNSVTVTDGSGALNVIVDSGSITANAGTNLNTSALVTTSDFNAAFGTAGTADAQVMSVQGITSMTPILTNPGTAANIGVYVEDAAETAGGNLAMAGTVRRDTAASSAGTTGDNATLNTDGIGRLWVREGSPCADHARITSAVINESTAATNEIVALNGSDLIYVCGYKWVTTAANSLNWKYGTGTDCATGTTSIEGAQPFAANGGVVENGGGYPLFIVPAGNALCLTSSAATAHGGRVTYVRTAAP